MDSFTAIAVVTAFIAGAIASVAGFGIGSVLTPVLATQLDVRLAIAAVSLPHLVGTFVRFLLVRTHIDRDVLFGFGAASAIGGLTGAALQSVVQSAALAIIFGALLIFAGAGSLTGLAQRMRFRGRVAALIGASLQAQVIARVIVYYRQWMALRLIAKPHPALEVHLPQQIGCRHLKALARHGASSRWLDTARSAQDLMHRRNRRRADTFAFQAPRNLASSPRRMGIAYRNNAPFKFVGGAPWARMRTARSVPESLICLPSAEPFITRVRVDTEPAAKLPPVHSLLHR